MGLARVHEISEGKVILVLLLPAILLLIIILMIGASVALFGSSFIQSGLTGMQPAQMRDLQMGSGIM